MNVNQFTYNDKRSFDDMEMIITETPPFVIAERDLTFTSISGKSGDLIEDNGRYKNITKTYKVAILADILDLPDLVRRIAVWLGAPSGYSVLSDSYEPEYFRYAKYSGKINIEDILLKVGEAELKFNCKPFRYRYDGQWTKTIGPSGGVLRNPEAFASVPYIKIIGSGDITLTIGESSFAFTAVDEYIEIDSEIMAAYKGTELQNNKVSFMDFPVLAPGWNNIATVGNVTKIEIIPRWCTL